MMTAERAAPTKRTPLWKKPPVVRLLLIALFAEIGYAVLNISAMPVYLKFERGFREDLIGLILVSYLLSEALFKSLMGHYADVIGRKRLIVLGPALSVITALLTLVVPHNWGAAETITILALRALDGLGAAMLWPAAFAQMGDTVEDKERQQAMSLLNTCYLMGVALAMWLGGVVNDLSRSRAASLYLASGLFLLVALTAYRFVPSGRITRQNRAKRVTETTEAGVGELMQSAKRIPAYLLLAVVTFAAIGFPMAIIKIFAEQQYGMSESAFGALVLPGVGAMGLLSVTMARIGDQMGRARAVHLGLGLCFAGISVVSIGAFEPSFRSAWALALGGIPVGLGFLLAIPAWFASVSDLDKDRRAAHLGAVMTAQGIGAMLGAPLGAACYKHLQVYGIHFGRYSPFLGCALCLLIGWLLSYRLLRDSTAAEQTTVVVEQSEDGN